MGKSKSIIFRLDQELFIALKIFAARQGKSITTILTDYIKEITNE